MTDSRCRAEKVPASRAGSVAVVANLDDGKRGMVVCHVCSRVVTANRRHSETDWRYDGHFGRPR